MNCTKCKSLTYTIDSRPTGKNSVRRRRECVKCAYRFSTYEHPTEETVVEQDPKTMLRLSKYILKLAKSGELK